MTKKICPSCKQDNIQLHLGGLAGMWECSNCGYLGPVVIEEAEEKAGRNPKKLKKRVGGASRSGKSESLNL